MEKRRRLFSVLIVGILLLSSPGHAAGPTDESAVFVGFTSLAPDVLILLDASQSMSLNPSGGTEIWGDSSCSGSFSATPGGTNTTDCSRLAISKRAVFSILDPSQNAVIDSSDQTSLNVRFGYMRFTGCSTDDPGGDYAAGCNQLKWPIGTNYSTIYCNGASSCIPTSGASTANCVNGETAAGKSTLASALGEAKLYLDYHKSRDTTAGECRLKSVVLITAGEDNLSCGGNGENDQTDQYKRRRNSVAMAKALADAGYKLYVVGFGPGMPQYLQNTLNWMGYYGGTQNTSVADSGDKSAYNPALNSSCEVLVPPDLTTTCGTSGLTTCAAANDPGTANLSGYAFFAANTSELTQTLSQTINAIREVDYSFATASVASSRVKDENNIYEGSLTYASSDPFWRGHLKKYDINADGTVGAAVWDAGSVLAAADHGGRAIKTLKAGALVAFNTSNITPQDLGYTAGDTTSRDKVVGYIRGNSTYNPEANNWKLGDVFRSTPMTIGSPSAYYFDLRDANTCTWSDSGVTKTGNAFECFRAAQQRTSASGNRLILVGANDGQLHAFKTLDGSEAWSIIPPNLLPKLKNLAHQSHPTSLTHQYFVDGPVTVADAWLGSGSGTSKTSTDWKTLMIFGLGRGGGSNLWSSSSSCDSGFNATYSATYNKYCGFYAFDVTDPLNPAYRWRLNPTASQAPYLGDPWGKFFVGRVKISGNEKWVGFIGGGFNSADCKTGKTCDTRGKGFFVVDLSNGDILWSYTRANNADMEFSLAGSPSIVDSDNDSFIDTAYIGDLGANVWRFKFCSASASSCGTADWSGGKLYSASSGEIRPIYTTPSVARDASGNVWVYWGTGDKSDPTASNAQEKMYAVKDNDRTTTYSGNDLDNITSGTYSGSGAGWYMNLSGQGQKILADPTVFGGVLYFTVYTPGDNRVCSQAGTADLFGVTATTGGGIFSGGSRSMDVGSGIPTAPVISFKPGGSPDMYVTVSGGAGVTSNTQRVNFNPPGVSNRSNVLYWRDRRLQ
jgi:Tfp pilus tip-associated adhesin PilY1